VSWRNRTSIKLIMIISVSRHQPVTTGQRHRPLKSSDNVTTKPPTSDSHGGDRKSEQVKIKSDNVTLDPGRGQMEGNEPTK
jgi:hypothetical protein